MYNPDLHNRASSVSFGDWPTFEEAFAVAMSEWPTASESRRAELAEGLQLIAIHNPTPPPPKPARPKKTVAQLQREWCNAPASARRIFNNNIAGFIRAHNWCR